MNEDVLNAMSRFDDQYRPDPGIRPGTEILADGNYAFEVLSADLGKANDGSPLLNVWMRALEGPSAGVMVDHAYWLNKREGCNRLGYDLVVLGFSEFEAGRSRFSDALRNALPRLRGMRFKARKVTEVGRDGKTYHKLQLAGRISTAPATAAGPPAGHRQPANPPDEIPLAPARTARPSDDEIPF